MAASLALILYSFIDGRRDVQKSTTVNAKPLFDLNDCNEDAATAKTSSDNPFTDPRFRETKEYFRTSACVRATNYTRHR